MEKLADNILNVLFHDKGELQDRYKQSKIYVYVLLYMFKLLNTKKALQYAKKLELLTDIAFDVEKMSIIGVYAAKMSVSGGKIDKNDYPDMPSGTFEKVYALKNICSNAIRELNKVPGEVKGQYRVLNAERVAETGFKRNGKLENDTKKTNSTKKGAKKS